MRASLLAMALALPLAGLVLATLPAPAEAQQADGWRKEIADKVQEAQAAGQKGNFSEAIRLLRDAKARGPLQPKEEHAVNELMIWAASSARDYRLLAQTIEERIATGRVGGADLVRKLAVLAGAYYEMSDWRNTANTTEKLISARGSATADDLIQLGTAQMQLRDYRSAAATLERAVPAAQRGGKPAKTVGQLLEMLNKAYFETGNDAKRIETLHRLMVVAPKADGFDQLVSAYQKETNADPVAMINLYRLGASKGLLSREHYGRYAEVALDLSSPGEAVAMLEKGMAIGAIKKDDRNTRLLADAKSQLERLRAGLKQQEAETQAMASGDAEARLATAYFTLKNYQKATEAAKRGVEKGRVRNPENLQMLLGVSLVESKRAGEAKSAFKAAAAASAKIRGVADLWVDVAT